MKRPTHRARPLVDVLETLPKVGCNRHGDMGVALALDLLAAAPREQRDATLGALRLPLWRTGRAELQAAAALLAAQEPPDGDGPGATYGWRSHAVLSSWLAPPDRDVAEQAWHQLHAGPRPPLSALLNLSELHRRRGEHGPARMLLGEAQQQLQGEPRSRCGVPDRAYAPLIEAMDQCNAGVEPDLELALLTDRELWHLLEATERSELRTDLWCTWRHADRDLRVRLRGVFSGTWLGPLPGPLDARELDDAEAVRAGLRESFD